MSILDVVILAAGKGTRMRSSKPKVMQTLAGKPLLAHVIENASELSPTRIHLVVGHGAEHVRGHFNGKEASGLNYIAQTEQLGTGHAVQQTLPHTHADGITLILYGDVPLVQSSTLETLVAQAQSSGFGLLSVQLDDPTGYGRIVRDANGKATCIVEQKDANAEQLKIQEVNTGMMAVKTALLNRWLPALSNDNAQGEYYLTDIVASAVADNVSVSVVSSPTELEVTGINNRLQQMQVERAFQLQQAEGFLAEGLALADAARFDVRGALSFGMDCVIDINCVFEGKVVLGNHVTIESNCVIKNCEIGDGTHIKANSVLDDSVIGTACDIGPYARVRPGTRLMDSSKIGNFVETKKALIGKGSKINHLSYVGDAEVGEQVNIGAGTITCNYDGVNKHKTQIEDGVFVGSNTAIVAPVKVGKNATIGAGSTITGNIEAEDLAVARSKQRNLKGWQRPQKK